MRQNPHVRICGGPGSATTLVYPTLELTVAAFGGHLPPAIGFDQLDGLTNLWHRAS